MTSATYGIKLDPYRFRRTLWGVKGERESSSDYLTQQTVAPNQTLTVIFPNLRDDKVIFPGTARLTFNLELDGGTDANSTVVNNLRRAIVKKIQLKFEGKELMCLDDADIYLCYRDLWMTSKERQSAADRGIHTGDDGNTAKNRLGAGDAVAATQPDASIAAAFGNRFVIPLDFEILTDHGPFYQAGLAHRLIVELTFNDYNRVITSTDVNAKYKITNIKLEHDVVTKPDLARQMRQQYASGMAMAFTQVRRHMVKPVNKSETAWNLSINTAVNSLKGILLLFEDPAPGAMGPAFGRNSEFYYNPLITKVEVSIDGAPNQLYSPGMLPHHHWEEIVKAFAREELKSGELPSVDISTYFQSQYALWLDFRSNDDRKLHGSGRRIKNIIAIRIEKTAQPAGPLNIYSYLLMDAQLNINEGQFKTLVCNGAAPTT